MRYAKSARARLALGATLVAIAIPATAGIDGGGVGGIDGGGAAGIDGGGIAGIDGGGAAGIDGGGIAGIDGGGAAGIDGGGIAGIDGGGIAGIDGGGITGIDGGGIAGIDGGGVLAGPIDRIDHVNGVFESMGQIVLASQDMLAGMNVGDFVTVEGSVVSPGWLYADTLDVAGTPYVPGATEVLVTGMMSSIDRLAGTAQIGGLTIDYTPSLAGGEAPSGAMWSFTGIRPTADGAMLSDRSIEHR